jgi:hypothetical protein
MGDLLNDSLRWVEVLTKFVRDSIVSERNDGVVVVDYYEVL